MKRTTVFSFITAALISMGSACAHAQAPAFKVTFAFAVDNQVFPPGSYQVSNVSQRAIRIQSEDRRFDTITLVNRDDKESYGVAKFIFAKYGDYYFLREVLCSDLSMNISLPTSRLEKQVRIEEAQLPHSETVAALRTGAK